MRTTLNIEDNLIDQATKITGIKEKTALVKLGLEALIARESARLAKLGGTQKQIQAIPRRKGASFYKSKAKRRGIQTSNQY